MLASVWILDWKGPGDHIDSKRWCWLRSWWQLMGEALSNLECILKGEVRTSAGGLDMVCEDLPHPLIIFWNLYWMVVRASYATHHFQFFFF